ncbi:MAG: hypothetical protein E6Q95_00415 [Chitinophagaceae bacterium]|nr:MAG: hypothetical protein E6Q95_00415 [Chitinophagaceae bacterium]
MLLKDVVGQENLKAELPHLLQNNRLAHALLFLGREGAGALPLAIAFAQFIVCERRNGFTPPSTNQGMDLFGPAPEPEPQAPLNDACGICASCVKASQLQHPDIHFSYPVITKKGSSTPPISTDYITEWRQFISQTPYGNAYDWLQLIGAENKQGNITARECNEIIRKLNLKSFESEYKVLILWLPEFLGTEGNKLLKLIEEPPAKTIFFLVAENEEQILSTILSRCQLIKVPMIDDDAIANALVQHKNLNADLAQKIALQSQGNFHEAIQLLADAENDWFGYLRDWLNVILKTGPIGQVAWVENISKLGREQQKQFLQYFIHQLHKAIRYRILGEYMEQQMSADDIGFIQKINKILALEQQEAIVDELQNANYYIERNANGKILFMALTVKIYHIIQNKVVFLKE